MLTVEEAASVLRIGRSLAYQMAREYDATGGVLGLPVSHVGGRLRVPAWAFATITASPGARTYHDQGLATGDTHHRALRALGNGLVGLLHGCLRPGTLYDEHTAGGHRPQLAA